jgi:hypothetical protein
VESCLRRWLWAGGPEQYETYSRGIGDRHVMHGEIALTVGQAAAHASP